MRTEAGHNWTMYAGDCLSLLPTLADDSVDVGMSDAPYDEQTHNKSRRGASADRVDKENPGGRASMNRKRSLGFAPLTADQMAAVAEQSRRIVTGYSLFFCSVEMVSDWKAAGERVGLEYIRTCFWHKVGGSPQFTGDRPAVACEAIVLLHRPGRKRWNGGGKAGIYSHAIELDRNARIRCHTTQKPLSLMKDLVADFSQPGDLILDCFAGSGTTGVAAGQLGRRFVGCEMLDGTIPVEVVEGEGKKKTKRIEYPDYFATACRRLRGEAGVVNPAQLDLFAAIGAA